MTDNLTPKMQEALDRIIANGRSIFYRWPGDHWTDVQPRPTIYEDLRARRAFVNPVWFTNGSVIRALERRGIIRAMGPKHNDPRELVITHLPPGNARGLEPETVGDQFIRQFGDPETYAATRRRRKT